MYVQKAFSWKYGFDFSVERTSEINRPYFAIWWCRGCDCGIQLGRRKVWFKWQR